MCWLIVGFLSLLVVFYPFAIKIEMNGGHWRLAWLPRVFCGWAKPRRLIFPSPGAPKKHRLKKFFRILHYIPCLKWEKLWFKILFSGGSIHPQGEGIISVRLWDIIRKSLRTSRRKWGRK